MTAKVLFIPFGGGGGGGEANTGANVGTGPGESFRDKTGVTLNFRTLKSDDGSVAITTVGDEIDLKAKDAPPAPACIPLLTDIGSSAGAAYGSSVAIPGGGSSQTRGLVLGGVFGRLSNFVADDDNTTLVSLEEVADHDKHFALRYLRSPGAGARIAVVLNGAELVSVPAPNDTHPVLIGAALIPAEAFGNPKVSVVIGGTIATEVEIFDSDFPGADPMVMRVAEDPGGGKASDLYASGGVFCGVPIVPLTSGDLLALALRPVSQSGRLDDMLVGILAAQVWVASALQADTSLDPWPELNGGSGLVRADLATPVYVENCTPAWGYDQTAAAGQNLGTGASVLREGTSEPGLLKFRSLVAGSAVHITENDDEIEIAVVLPPGSTTLQEAYDASGAADPQIQLGDANGPVAIHTDGTTLSAAMKLQKGIEYGDDFNTSPNFRLFTTAGGFAGKNTGVIIEGQDNTQDDPLAEGGDIINKAGSNVSGGVAGIGGSVIHQAGEGPATDGTVDNKVGTTLVFQSKTDQNTSFFDLLLSSVLAATRKLIYVATGGTWSYEVDSEVVDAVGHGVKWPGKPTRDAGDKFQVGDIISVREDDANNAVTEWIPFGTLRQIKASYVANNFTAWNGGNWTLPKNNATAEVVPNRLQTALAAAQDFAKQGGNGGRVEYDVGGLEKTFRVTITFTVIRPPAISLDARGIFFIGRRPAGDPDYVQIDSSQQFHRFNIVDCDSVITVETLVEMASGDALALMGTSDAGALGSGLEIEIKGYTLTVTEV